jgi:5-carboxymethyl-2-hydroxymuconic-semialdehyde dehydrogenase
MSASTMLEVGGCAVDARHFIAGERVGSPDTFEVFSPIDGRLLGRVASGRAEEVDRAVDAAAAAFASWSRTSRADRCAVLERFAAEISRRAEAFAILESNDAGVLMSRLQHGVVPRAAQNIAFFAAHALTLDERRMDAEHAFHHIKYDPAGVVGIITPWNSPLLLSTWKLGPALAAGNTVVLKPPEWAPLTCSLLADAAQSAGLPAGVLNMVQGSGEEAGTALTRNPQLARISFTGSAATARRIAGEAAAHLTPCSFELGGKSPFIVLEDADLAAAAATATLMYRNAGQVCLAGTRLLVHRDIADEFIASLRHNVSRLVVGDPRERATEVGPLIHQRQLERVEGYVSRAVQAGATVQWGGARHERGGLYFQPTLFTNVEQRAEIVQHEVFGPVLTLQTFATDDEAIALANDSDYGLGGVCYGALEHATHVANQVHTGFIWVNSFGLRDLAAPFGGCKRSGIGREGGDWSFEFFCDVKDVVTPKQPFKASFSLR